MSATAPSAHPHGRGRDGNSAGTEQLARALDGVDEGFALIGAAGDVLACNAAWTRWHRDAIGHSPVPGMAFDALLAGLGGGAPGWLPGYRAHLRAASGDALEIEWRSGTWLRARFQRTGNGGVLARLEDVSESSRREARLREEADRFRSFAESSGDWLFELDANLRYVFTSGAGGTGLAPRDGDLLGESFLEHLRSSGDPRDIDPVARSLRARQPLRDCQVRLGESGAAQRVVSLNALPLAGADGAFRGYRGSARNVTEAHRLASRLAYQASHDDLTGLANRRALEARIAHLLGERPASSRDHAVCFLDVDQIKLINDTCGHAAGDALLNRLARLLHDGLRGADTVARLGGDEFAVLLRDCDKERAVATAEKLRQAISRCAFTWEGQQFHITASIGVAPLGSGMTTASDVMRAADSACYAAKERGRNRVKLYTLDDSTLNLRQGEMHWVARIHAALAEGRLELLLQPIAPAAGSDGLLHFEALLRMRASDGRVFTPGAFLPAAERYNLASQIDAWVLDETLGWLERSPLFLDHLAVMSVNLSGQSLGEAAFLARVQERMRSHPRAARKLCFEITETAAISNLDAVQEFMATVRASGVRFALDDFGAGLSSFAYLRTLDVDYLKIDGMFVKDMHEDPIHAAMVRSINEVGHVMGKKTIAEFVEHDEVRAKLAAMGVDYVQGYAIGRPVPFGDVV